MEMTQKFQLRQIRQRRCMAATGQAISRRDWVPQREMGTGRQGPWAGLVVPVERARVKPFNVVLTEGRDA